MTDSRGHELHLLQSRVTGRYSIEREIGRGGMGVVYLARDVSLDRRVAIKLLPQEFTTQATLRERFIREARLAARLSHPNIVPVYSVEEHPDAVFYAMGFVEGESLAERIARVGQLAPAEVATIVQQVAWALAYAHGNNVVHRDIKPDNILLEQGTGRAWVMDFGIARAFGALAAGREPVTKLTQVGHVVGTAAYMSPEQAAGEEVDGRSDLYSLGVVAYQALTGRLPLEATSAQSLLAKHLTEVPPPVASVRPGVPAALAKAVDQLLSKDPAARFATGEALADALGATGSANAEVPPPLRSFLRAVELNFAMMMRLAVLALAIALIRPSAAFPIVMTVLGTVGGALAEMAFRVRRLATIGYRWPDIRDAVAVDAIAREEERRALAVPPDPAKTRQAGIRAVMSLAIGIGGFVATIVFATGLKGRHDAWAQPLAVAAIVIGAVFMIVFTTPLGYFAAMRRSQRPMGARNDRPSPALRLLAAPAGRTLFHLATRGVAALPPRNAAGALDALLGEVESNVAQTQRGIVQSLRARLDALQAESDALRTRERSIDRAIAEAGSGPAAEQMAAARAAIPPQLERIAAAVDAARLKLLLVRSGVTPVTDLSEFTNAP